MFDLIVLGGGPAGVTAALRARELGASVMLIERGRMGGVCTNDGCVPTRVLAHAARLRREIDQAPDYGLDVQLMEVDFVRALRRAQQVVYKMQEKKQLVGHLNEAGVAVIAGSGAARFEDPYTVSMPDGQRLQARQFIIAVGGHARRLPFPGSDLALTHSDVWDLKFLPRQVAVVGGAATGSQLASIFASFGTQVYLLDAAPRLMPAEDAAVSEAMRQAFEQRGIRVITGIQGIDSLERAGQALQLTYQTSYGPQRLAVDAVVLAVGWPGNLESLNLEAAGVETERGYIKVGDDLRTSAGHIFAAGDITGRLMLVQTASYAGAVAAENAMRGNLRAHDLQIVPRGGFTDPEYASVGLTEEQAAGHNLVISLAPYLDVDRAVIDGRTDGFCKLVIDADTRRILGAHVVGEQAVEIVQIAAVTMAADAPVETLANLELAYPSYCAILGLAARRAARKLGASEPSPLWRSLGRVDIADWERRARPELDPVYPVLPVQE